jgi:hypothetical protein
VALENPSPLIRSLDRFMSEDPKLFDAGDYNLYRYCHNDPIDFTDPMGWAPIDVPDDVDALSRHGLDVLHREALSSGHGMEIATSTYRESGSVLLSKERELGKGTPYGAQKVSIPPPKPGSGKDPESGLHVHRNDIQVDPKDNPLKNGGTLSTRADRHWADAVKNRFIRRTRRERLRSDIVPTTRKTTLGLASAGMANGGN